MLKKCHFWFKKMRRNKADSTTDDGKKIVVASLHNPLEVIGLQDDATEAFYRVINEIKTCCDKRKKDPYKIAIEYSGLLPEAQGVSKFLQNKHPNTIVTINPAHPHSTAEFGPHVGICMV